jgi:hypothetical protein
MCTTIGRVKICYGPHVEGVMAQTIDEGFNVKDLEKLLINNGYSNVCTTRFSVQPANKITGLLSVIAD